MRSLNSGNASHEGSAFYSGSKAGAEGCEIPQGGSPPSMNVARSPAKPCWGPRQAIEWRRELAAGVCQSGIHDLATLLAETGAAAEPIPGTRVQSLHAQLRRLAAILRVNPREKVRGFYWLDCIRSALKLWDDGCGPAAMTIQWQSHQEPWLRVEGNPDLWLQTLMSWLWDLRAAGITALWLHTRRLSGNRVARCEFHPQRTEPAARRRPWSAETLQLSRQIGWQISDLPSSGWEIRFSFQRTVRAPAPRPSPDLMSSRHRVVRILAITHDDFWQEWLKKWTAPATLCCHWAPDLERARLCLRSRPYQAVMLEWEHLGVYPEAAFYSLLRANPGRAGQWLTLTSDAGNPQFQAAMRSSHTRWLSIPFEPEHGRSQLQKILAG